MTLTNPTDDELNAAFAEKVAGWLETYWENGELWAFADKHEAFPLPKFTRSFDAMLPWLEKWHDADPQNRDVRMFRRLACDWIVKLSTRPNTWVPWNETFEETGDIPRAAVIALLRAHGVEIIFT